MNKISKTEILIYATLYATFVAGYHIYCNQLEKNQYQSVSYETRRILWGLYNPQGTDFEEACSNLNEMPYLACYFFLCLLINIFDVPCKINVVEFVSIGVMISVFGLTLTGVIYVIMVTSAIIGKLLRGIQVLPQIYGLILLAYSAKVLGEIEFLKFSESFESSTLAYAGFYAHVVRAMLICCEYASEKKQVTWRRLFSESLGYVAFTNVFMAGSFVVFSDWKQWRDGLHEFVWNSPFTLVKKKMVGKATVVRKLSALNFLYRISVVAFWILVHKYFTDGVDFINVMAPIVDRALKKQIFVSDWGILSFIILMIVLKFNVYYYIFYNISRLVGDFQQFLLSPAFSTVSASLIGGDEEAIKVWNKTTLLEKLLRVEIETECLMPEGPCFLPGVETSSAVWRKFDVGLYNVLKHYIYIPWMGFVTRVFVGEEKKEGSSLSPLISNISAICGAAFTFIFVLTFHNWTKGNKVWVAFSFTLWFIERMVIQACRKHKISDYLDKHYSPAWEQRIRCTVCALLQVVNTTSFFCFVTNFETGWFIMRTMFTTPCSHLPLAITLYFSLNLRHAFNGD